MSDPAGLTVTLTLAEIARIAGVGRAAVSNWRRRHPSFPAAVGGTDSSPLFSLTEVEGWLRDNEKIGETGGRDLLWPRLEALGERDAAGVVIAAAGARMAGMSYRSDLVLDLPAAQLALVDKVVELGRHEGPQRAYDFLLRRWQQANARQLSFTPPPLARLMAELVDAVGGPAYGVRTVLDPACGAGGLLAAAIERWSSDPDQAARRAGQGLELFGQERDPVLAGLGSARLALALDAVHGAFAGIKTVAPTIRVGDTLLADVLTDTRADVVLCSPPFNARDWGREALVTDVRWTYGLPPGTEPELAWVQHALARLAPGGVAVMLMPPAVASRRAGRQIRAALLEAGVLRAVVALPAGCAPPYSVALHVWVLRAPSKDETTTENDTLLVDAAASMTEAGLGPPAGGRGSVDWTALGQQVLGAIHGDGGGWVSLPAVSLIDDQVDLTPARHVPSAAEAVAVGLRRSWTRLGTALDQLRDLSEELANLASVSSNGAESPVVTIGELQRESALSIRAGQAPASGSVQVGKRPQGAVPMLMVPDLLLGGRPTGWIPAEEADAAEHAGTLTLTTAGDVVVAAVSRAFSVWVDTDAPTALGPQLYILRPDPALLDPWFLAGCLRAPSNARQAGTHSSVSARVDVRRLQLLRLPLDQQRRYGVAARKVASFERSLRETHEVGSDLVHGLSEALLAGGLR